MRKLIKSINIKAKVDKVFYFIFSQFAAQVGHLNKPKIE